MMTTVSSTPATSSTPAMAQLPDVSEFSLFCHRNVGKTGSRTAAHTWTHISTRNTRTTQIGRMSELSEYEQKRLENIQKNQEMLNALGIDSQVTRLKPVTPKKYKQSQNNRKRRVAAPLEPRKSARIAKQPAPDYKDTVKAAEVELAKADRGRGVTLKHLPIPELPDVVDEDYDPDYRAPAPSREDTGILQFEKGYEHFTPNLTPEEMMRNGSFGGTFFRPIYSRVAKKNFPADFDEFPAEWYEGLDTDKMLSSEEYDIQVNKYRTQAGQGLEEWETAGWIRAQDPRGWFQWYCRFYIGRRTPDDDRQIRRWMGVCGLNGRFKRSLVKKIAEKKGERGWDDEKISPQVRQTLQHWGYRLTLEDYRAYIRGLLVTAQLTIGSRGVMIFLLLCLSLVSVVSSDVSINANWTVTDSQLNCFTSQLKTTSFDQILFHWGDTERAMTWIRQGFISNEEMQGNILRDEGMLAGGGLYLSSSPIDSILFGQFSTSHPIPAGTLVYNASALACFGRNKITLREKAQLGAVVPFIDFYKGTWSVVHTYLLTQQVYPSAVFGQTTLNIVGEFDLRAGLWNITGSMMNSGVANMLAASEFIPRMYSSICYRDGVEVQRIITTMNTTTPWKYFDDVQDYEAFHSALMSIYNMSESNRNTTVPGDWDPTWGAEGLSQTDYVELQMSVMIPQIFSIVTGTNGTDAMYRDGSYRSVVQVSRSQLSNMMNNSYLSISISDTASNGDVTVSVSYPDITALSKLNDRGVVPSQLYQSLKAYSSVDIRRNATLRSDLNRKLMRGLMRDVLNKMYDQSLSQTSAQFIWYLMSIRPFNQRSDLVTKSYYRLVEWSARREGDQEGFVYNSLMDYISDMTLLSSPTQNDAIMMGSGSDIIDLLSMMLSESLEATYQLKDMDFSDLVGWKKLMKRSVGDINGQLNATAWECAKRRNWLCFFDQLNPNWRKK
ncbi:hypothetical protein PROFUN_08891 [Planoprotostelium fungivorum]|uniref:Uncharacterized protein n=1 Tax=Planoprotostelium fungivorum TaxID=1890364 RepID=A0A2P6NIS9_9EUKA|nr:hypothetical protein PROFUN_08891 [Planoprotostelium fungivorum]